MKKLVQKTIKPFLPIQQLLRAGGLTFFFRIGGLGLNFIITRIITHTYGEAVFGSYSLAFTIAQATGIFFALGFPNALISYIGLRPMQNPHSQYMLRKGIKVLAPIILLPLLAYFFGAAFIANDVFSKPGLYNYLLIAAFTVPAMVLHEFMLYFFIATGNNLKFNIFMFGVPNVVLLCLLFFIKNVPGHYTFLFYFISVALTLAAECFFSFKNYKGHKDTVLTARQMVAFASPMMFSGVMLYLLNWTDVFMLGAQVSEKSLAHYNLAYKIASLSMLVIISMNVVLAPKIASLFNGGNLDELHKTVRKTTHIIIVLTTPLATGIIIFSNFLLGFFGNGFMGGKEALIIITIGFWLNALTGNVDQILNMTGNQKILQNITIAGFIVNVSLNFLLIPRYGINGAAMASLLTNVLFNLTCLAFIKKKLGFYTFM